MIIVFGWTWPALVAGHKTVTRRGWKPEHAAKFQSGQVIDVYDRSPRAKGGKIGEIALTEKPYLENTGSMPDSDYQQEGLEWLDRHPDLIPPGCRIDFKRWREAKENLYVVRFVLKEVYPHALQKLQDKMKRNI